MKTIIPDKLKRGDKIMVIAPACSAKTIAGDQRKRAENALKDLGFNLVYGKNVFEIDVLDSSSIKSRLIDLHSAFKDKNVKGIICARGGFNSNALLPEIDWELVKKNPKPLFGYSDITSLSNAILARTGLVTYSGPGLSSFGHKNKNTNNYLFDYFRKCLMEDKPYSVVSSSFWKDKGERDEKNPGMKIVQEGKAEGVIIGGNLCTMNLLQGTPYMPNLSGAVLFVEDDAFAGTGSMLEFDRNLESLLQTEGAKNIKALIVGRFQKASKMTDAKIRHILKSKRLSKKIPIIINTDFGHTMPMFTYPIGGTIRIVAKKKTATLTILKH